MTKLPANAVAKAQAASLLLMFLLPNAGAETSTEIKHQKPVLTDSSIRNRSSGARIIDLSFESLFTNTSTVDIPAMQQHVSIPSSPHDYQLLLDIKGTGFTNAQIVEHKNREDRYLKLTFPLKPKSSARIKIVYRLLIIPVDYNKILVSTETHSYTENIASFTKPSKNIESDSPEIVEKARQMRKTALTDTDTAKLAYQFPSQHLKFEVQKKSLGALTAYKIRKGDCTEYSALFTALCRAAGIPARQYSVFSMGDAVEKEWSQPNHTAAEVYLEPAGWIPVDPNLSYGKFTNKHSFGKTTDNIIYFVHEGAWVHGKNTGQKQPDQKLIQSETKWRAKVIVSGRSEDLFNTYRNKQD